MKYYCHHCNKIYVTPVRFCATCGKPISRIEDEKVEASRTRTDTITSIIDTPYIVEPTTAAVNEIPPYMRKPPKMTFAKMINNNKRYKLKGRMARKEYIYGQIAIAVIAFFFFILINQVCEVFGIYDYSEVTLFMLPVSLATLMMGYSLNRRRIQDMGWSNVVALAILVFDILNIAVTLSTSEEWSEIMDTISGGIILVLAVWPTQVGENEYGPQPPETISYL